MGKFSSLEGRNTPPILPINWADWEGDEHVKYMNETMQGVYFLIVKSLWREDRIEFDYKIVTQTIGAKDWRNVRTFLEKWGHLFRCTECDGRLTPRWGHVGGTHPPCRYCVGGTYCACTGDARFAYHEKLKKYKKNAISGSRLGAIQLNVTEGKQTNTTKESVGVVSVSKTSTNPTITTPPESPSHPDSAPFDPLSYAQPVTGKSGTVYPAEQVRRILDYHFKHSDNPFWKSIDSVARLRGAIDSMSAQVPADWTAPAPPHPKTRLAGDPACRSCRGRGSVGKRMEGSLARYSVACEACEKHEETLVNGQWVRAQAVQL